MAMQYIYGTDTVQQGFNKINENFLNVPSGTTEEILQQAQEQAEEYTNSVISNPNILLNSNFADPVNQKGQTTYTENGITIDMWQLSATNTSLSLQNGYIQIDNMSNNAIANLYQALEVIYAGQTLTISINAKGNFNILALNQNGEFSRKAINAFEFTTFTNTFTVPAGSTSLKIYFNVPNNSTANIKWVKLEEGSVATAYNPYSYSCEFLNCLRYFRRIQSVSNVNTLIAYGKALSTTVLEVLFDMPVEMRILPTVTGYENLFIETGKNASNVTYWGASTDKTKINLRFNFTGLTTNNIYAVYLEKNQALDFDANIY